MNNIHVEVIRDDAGPAQPTYLNGGVLDRPETQHATELPKSIFVSPPLAVLYGISNDFRFYLSPCNGLQIYIPWYME